MTYLYRQFMLMIGLTVIVVVSMLGFMFQLVHFNFENFNFIVFLLLFYVPTILLLDFYVLYLFFRPIHHWMKTWAAEHAMEKEDLLQVVTAIMQFPYKAGIYFFAAIEGSVAFVFVMLLLKSYLSINYIVVIVLASLMVSSVCAPFYMHLCKVILRPLKKRILFEVDQRDLQRIKFNFGIRKNLIMVILSVAVFSVLFGGLLTFTLAQKSIRKQAVDHLAQSIKYANEFVKNLETEVDDQVLLEISNKFQLGNNSFVFFVRKGEGEIVARNQTFSPEAIQSLARGNSDIFNDYVALYKEDLNSKFNIGGLYSRNDFAEVTKKLNQSFFILVSIALLIGFLLALFYSGDIVYSIKKVIKPLEPIKNGVLTQQIKMISEDETAILASHLEEMRNSLYTVNVKIKNASNVILKNAQQLFAGMEEMNISSKQISDTSYHLSDSVEKQFQEVEHMATVMDALKASYAQVAGKAENTAGASRKASITAVQGSHEIQEIVNQMEEIKSVVTASRLSVDQLREKTNAIGDSIGIITKIARNTNQLALNAAIEAARSGEAGKGFAVVAEEVRKLAESSTDAAMNIQEKVKEILIVAQRVSNTMVKGEEEVEHGRDLVINTNNSFREIVDAFQNANRLSMDIAKETEEQSRKTEKISQIMQHTTNITEMTTATSKEVKEIVIQQNRSMDDMLRLIKKINALAEELQQLVNRYKLSQ